LTDTIPAALDVAIARGSRTPVSTGSIAWHQFDKATFAMGRHEIAVPGTELVIGIYSPERSIADAFRFRGDVGAGSQRNSYRSPPNCLARAGQCFELWRR